MNGYLKQSTAGQVRTIGPFVDDTDFKTLENALTINNTDIVISINGGADTTKNSGGATAHGAGGIYTLTWDATDTASIGELYYSVKVAGALVVFGTYVVLDEAVYDALFGTTALATATNITSATGITVSALGANVITAASIATGAIDADALATDAVNEIVDAVWDEAQADHVAAGSFGVVASEIADILVDTAEIGAAGAGLTNINLPDQTMNITGNITGNLSGSVGSVTAGVSIANGAITTTTFGAGAIDAAAIAANAIGASELATDAAEEIADTILGRNVAGGSSAGRTVSQAMYALRNKVAIAAGTMTVYQTDDTTSSWTASVSTTAGDPISTIDPA